MGRRWSRIPVALLGTMPDAEIARRHGCSPTAVGTRRRRLGIPAAPTRLDSIPERAGGVLGEYTDATAAVILGVSEHTARRWRIRLGREAAGSDLWASIPRGADAAVFVRDLAQSLDREVRDIEDTLLRWHRRGRVRREKRPTPTGRQGPQSTYAYWRDE